MRTYLREKQTIPTVLTTRTARAVRTIRTARVFLSMLSIFFLIAVDVMAQSTPVSQMERLNRGAVAVMRDDGGYMLSWRLFGYDSPNTTFDVKRNGAVIATGLAGATCYEDPDGQPGDKYTIIARVGETVVDTTPDFLPMQDYCLRIPIDLPEGGSVGGRPYRYTPNDCSVGDVDGDGEYEIIVKWDPTNAADNSFRNRFTGKVYFDCYKLDGTKLWRVDLGQNIRAGAHYTQFLFYDFDCDGRAELICKTAPNTMDGTGHYVSEASTDATIQSTDNTISYVNYDGHVLNGPEYLTVFEGLTGKALHTIYYRPNRAGGVGGSPEMPGRDYWGDDYGNRSERYLACVAYLDGPDKSPSAVMCRGYYTRSHLWAVDFDGKQLHHKWLHASVSRTEVQLTDASGNVVSKTYQTNTSGIPGKSCTAFGQGAHSVAVGDVDGDGCDEIMYGSAAINNDGSLLYSTGLGHGDAMHLSDIVPDRPGLEYFMVLEERPYGRHLRDARTGELLYYTLSSGDNGRGLAADIFAEYAGLEYWDIFNDSVFSAQCEAVAAHRPSINFRIYWDGDLQDELFDSRRNVPSIYKVTLEKDENGQAVARSTEMSFCGHPLGEIYHSTSCNSTKGTPNLQADILGDWREELILWDRSDASHLNIFTTNIPTVHRLPTLMHDHVYRMGVTWQNVAYNQPPHLGFFRR